MVTKKYEEDYDYEDEDYQEKEVCPISDMLLLRLSQVSYSTRKGMIDKGFPMSYTKLAALGYVKSVSEGYVVTDLGRAFLSKWHQKLEAI